MQLREARLCLDCEELHTEERCPVCASEAFAFVTRWLPVDERRARGRRPPPQTQTPSSHQGARWLKAATAGVALATAAQWLWRALPVPVEDPTAERRKPGDPSRRESD
jgi:hypothetical protein